MELKSHKVQASTEGKGPLYHRIYSITFPGTIEEGKRLMQDVQNDMNAFSPQLMARFEKVKGSPTELKNGDEIMVHITGPWNGPVRVCDVGLDRFRLLTLEGHLEAGEIQFRMMKADESHIKFEIESLARSADAIINFLYDKVPVVKLAQTEMWIHFCKNVGEYAAEVKTGEKKCASEVEVITERRDEETGQWQAI